MISIAEFLHLAFINKMFYKKSWRIQVSLIVQQYRKDPFYPFIEDGKHYFINAEGEQTQIDNEGRKGPLLTWKDTFDIEPDHLPGITKKINTQYGIWLINVIGWQATYGSKTPYINEPLNPGSLNAKYTDIYNSGIVDDNQAYMDCISDLESLIISDCELGVKSSSRAMMNTDKEGEKLRQQLLKEYGDKINDPVIQAEFDAKMIAHKKALVAKTDAKDYYGKGGKLYDVILMKTDVRLGADVDTTGTDTKFIAKSLNEGLDIDNMESWVNTSITGSFSRGALTALSGADVKEVMRAMSSLMVSEQEDCKTKRGWRILVSNANVGMLEGVYELGKEKDGLITSERAKTFIGKYIDVRAPSGCQLPSGLYCKTCMGRSTKPNGIPGGCADLDSTLMYVVMSRSHATSKEARKLDLLTHTS